jgi:hypothetical protein
LARERITNKLKETKNFNKVELKPSKKMRVIIELYLFAIESKFLISKQFIFCIKQYILRFKININFASQKFCVYLQKANIKRAFVNMLNQLQSFIINFLKTIIFILPIIANSNMNRII